MPLPPEVEKLCETFANNLDYYKSTDYNETLLRRQFLDPFWEALGWDINNKSGFAPAYTDVIHEASIKIKGGTKAPDYAFSINGGPNPSAWKFFLEAKKPAVNIHDNPEPARQVRRYGWSAKLPLCVLSDFEELAIYDTRIRPSISDKPTVARRDYITFEQYPDKWEHIAATFSREAVLKGSFDKYADTKRKKGTEEVDDAFLSEIEAWREVLARNIAKNNPQLTNVRDFNYAVQITIDRLIFLRMAEDRGTEDHGRLKTATTGKGTYTRLLKLFEAADARYNSGLFHFAEEKERPSYRDALTPSLKIDDQALKDIILSTYPPKSAYEFSVLPADILGQVYEQFLGKTIQLGGGELRRSVKIEEKPEVRKAGGVFYTPKYIVDYIVENTLGRLLNGTTAPADLPAPPKPLSLAKAAKLKVLDPACGSGSFLIVAYQYLLDWHRDQYTLNPETRQIDPALVKKFSAGKSPKIYRAPSGEYRLTTPERKRILLNNIHGVDIDPQAVEVTKLSLLLKVLEGETQQQLQRDFLTERQRILPDLAANIQCGNSLIGPDFYDQPDLPDLDEETRERINVFDWERSFSEVFAQGGFDCVIGNPPYIRIQSLREFAPDEADYYKNKYASADKGNFDIYVCFLEKTQTISSKNSLCGFIVPNKFQTTDYGSPLRRLLTKKNELVHIHDFKQHQVFSATIYTSILILGTSPRKKEFSASFSEANAQALFSAPPILFQKKEFTESPWDFASPKEKELRIKINNSCIPLLSLPATMSRGLSTGHDKTYFVDPSDEAFLEKTSLIPISARDFGRYSLSLPKTKKLITPYRISEVKSVAISEEEITKTSPASMARLNERKKVLLKRKQYSKWHLFSAPRNLSDFSWADILVPLLAEKGRFSLLPEKLKGRIVLMASGGFGIRLDPKCLMNSRYILGLLNSRLLFWELSKKSNVFRGGWITCTKQFFGNLPIRPIDFSNHTDVSLHDKMVTLVQTMLDLHKKKKDEQNPQTLRRLETDITTTDRQIDRLVYQLYDLTPEEIALVEAV